LTHTVVVVKTRPPRKLMWHYRTYRLQIVLF